MIVFTTILTSCYFNTARPTEAIGKGFEQQETKRTYGKIGSLKADHSGRNSGLRYLEDEDTKPSP